MDPNDSGRNLLFGLLALQMDLVERELLVAAWKTWMQGTTRPFVDILVDSGAIEERDRGILEPLVERHIEAHDGDSTQSVHALSSHPETFDVVRLLSEGDADSTFSVAKVQAGDTSIAPTIAPRGTASEPRLPGGESRFQILRPHARGGIGEVFLAKDKELNREVALKEIQARFASDLSCRQRFLAEAEITGGLEHPGIVPVYGLGSYSDGRPYYAMRLIKGDSLQEAAQRFHGHSGDLATLKSANDFESVVFRKLLGRFIDVCQAIEYAHSRGVLHRDLKPSNVMLGDFGETLVVDWGLAKAGTGAGATTEDSEAQSQTASSGTSDITEHGSIIGTPAYMPPEQAAGKIDELGPASDVYSLGATLYYLLTGRSPFAGKSVPKVLQAVRAGKFPPPRSLQANVPKPLESICLKAMSLKSGQRYASPQQLADDVERFLADEPVSAFAEPISIRARRWVRKHPAWVASTAAVVLVSIGGLAIFSYIVSGKNAELSLLNSSLDQSNTQLKTAKSLAETNEQAARQQSQLALETLASVINDIQVGLKDLTGSGPIRRRLLATSLEKLDSVATDYLAQASIDLNTMLALVEMGDVVLQFGASPSERMASDEAPKPPEERSADRLASSFFSRAHSMAQALAGEQPNSSQALRNLAITHSKMGSVLQQTGHVDQAASHFQKAFEIRTQLAKADPGGIEYLRELLVSHSRLGDVSFRSGQLNEAKTHYEEVLRILQKLGAADSDQLQLRQDLSVAHNKLGEILLQFDQADEALDHFQESLEISQKLLDAHPDSTLVQSDLAICHDKMGDARMKLGQINDALNHCQRSLELRELLAKTNPGDVTSQRNLSVSHDKMANVVLRTSGAQQAMEHLQRSLEICQSLAAVDPDSLTTQRYLAVAQTRLGELCESTGRVAEAVDYHEKSLTIRKTLLEAAPGDARAQQDLAEGHEELGQIRLRLNLVDDALTHFNESLAICKTLAAAQPNNADLQRRLSSAYSMIGDVLLQLKDEPGSLEHFQKSLEIDRARADANPENTQIQHDLSVAYANLLQVSLQFGRKDEALEYGEQLLSFAARLVDADPDDALAQRTLLVAHLTAGDAKRLTGKPEEALAHYQESLVIAARLSAVDPANVEAQRDFAVAHERVGDYWLRAKKGPQAISHFQQGLEVLEHLAAVDPTDPVVQESLSVSYSRLGDAYRQLGQIDEMFEKYRQSLEVRERIASGASANSPAKLDLLKFLNQLSTFCLKAGRFDEAQEYLMRNLEITQAIAAELPEKVGARRNEMVSHAELGNFFVGRDDLDSALKHYQGAASVLREMIEDGLSVERSRQELAMFEQQVNSVAVIRLAIGPWESLLEQPQEQWPTLLELRGIELVKRGKFESAAQAATMMRELDPITSSQLYNAACTLCRCAQSIKPSDNANLTDEQITQRDEWIAEALEVLGKAVEVGWDDFERMQNDEDLEILRDRPEFKDLIPE